MTSETLTRLHQARPFQSFDIHLADGRALRVAHPELLAYAPGNRMAVLVGPKETFEHIDLLLVTSIAVHSGNGRTRKLR
jgi:hypothetical protein